MNRTTHFLTLTTLVLSTIIVTMIVSPAVATKRYAAESGDIAFVDVFNLIDKALLSDDLAAGRDDFNVKSQEAVAGLQTQIQTLETQLSTMDPSDPNGAAVYQEYQGLQGQLQNASQQINASYQTLIAQQIAQGYGEIYAAANEIGAEQGFTFVFSSRADGELIQIDSITGITQEILARPLMTPPGSVDLTELVRIKLGYPEKAPEPAVPAVESEPTAPTEPVTEEAPVTEDE